MNHLPSTPDPFDRLADGEISESERRQLLASLDQEPNGWRRCALAFLEAQCWKKELGDLRNNVPAGSSAITPVARPTKRHLPSFGLWGTLLAMAASFLLVLGAGVWWQHSGNKLGGVFGDAGSNQIAGKTGEQSATIHSEAQTAVAQASPEASSTPWQWVQLSPAGSTDSDQVVQLPAVQRDRIDQQWLQSLPSPIPENVLWALHRGGYEVQTQQELMPMPLKDGRRLVVPIDQVNVQYVGNKTY